VWDSSLVDSCVDHAVPSSDTIVKKSPISLGKWENFKTFSMQIVLEALVGHLHGTTRIIRIGDEPRRSDPIARPGSICRSTRGGLLAAAAPRGEAGPVVSAGNFQVRHRDLSLGPIGVFLYNR
jgi:hypothetical protein